MADFLTFLFKGISVGSLYALIALGYTMVYGILQFINFAHSDVFALGAFFSWRFAVAYHLMHPSASSGEIGPRGSKVCYRFTSPWSPWPFLTFVFALLRRSLARERPTLTSFLNSPC